VVSVDQVKFFARVLSRHSGYWARSAAQTKVSHDGRKTLVHNGLLIRNIPIFKVTRESERCIHVFRATGFFSVLKVGKGGFFFSLNKERVCSAKKPKEIVSRQVLKCLLGLLDQLVALAIKQKARLGRARRLGRGGQMDLLLDVRALLMVEGSKGRDGTSSNLRLGGVVGRHDRVHGLVRGLVGRKTVGTTAGPAFADVVESVASSFLVTMDPATLKDEEREKEVLS
jgi:hypothetical protein